MRFALKQLILTVLAPYMQRLINQYKLAPFHIFLPLALLALLYSFFRWGDNTILQVGNNCIVIPATYFLLAASLFFTGQWAVYELVHRDLFSRYLAWLHVTTTVLFVMIISTSDLWHDNVLPKLHREVDSWKELREQQMRESKMYLPLLASFLTGQTAFIANLVLTFFHKKHRVRSIK